MINEENFICLCRGTTFLMLECLINNGERMGLSKELAVGLAYKTLIGTCKLIEATNLSPAEIIAQVTSPGGTTEAGMEEFRKTSRVFQQAIDYLLIVSPKLY